MTSYRERRKAELADMKASRIAPVRVARAITRNTMRPPTDEELARVVELLGPVERADIEVHVDGQSFIQRIGRRYIYRVWEKPQAEGKRSGKAHVYSAGDTTTVATNPDGSPYVFKTGSRAEQKAELKAAIRAGNPELANTDINVFE